MFLSTVASTNGTNFLCCLTKSRFGTIVPIHKQLNFADQKAVDETVEALQARGTDIYMALGAFKRGSDGVISRKAANCTYLRSLWLDIDAGKVKYHKHGDEVYKTRDDAYTATLDFIEAANMPIPTYIVGSGEGLHVYWAFTADVDVTAWRQAAKLLSSAAKQLGYKVDPARTTDAASIMRLPGTVHSESGNTVEILYAGDTVEFQTIVSALSAYATVQEPKVFDWMADAPAFAAEETGGGIMADASAPKKFAKIIALESEERAGCAQLYHIYKNQNSIQEPLWRAGLSIAAHCDDSAEWIHKISDQYENYIPDEAETKARACKGPYTCDTFEQLRPEGCAGCPHKARGIKSPIVLGLNPDNVPVSVVNVNPRTALEEVIVIPAYPAPFFRKPTGGVWAKVRQRVVSPDGVPYETEVEKCVWKYDFYVTERVAEVATQKYWCRHHSPQDGVIEFELSSDDVAIGGESLWKSLYGFGLPVQDDMRKLMSKYLQSSVKHRVETAKARDAVHSMGWTDDDTFILGDKEYTSSGVRAAPVSSSKIAKMFSTGTQYVAPSSDPAEALQEWCDLLREAYPNEHKSALAGQYLICAAIGAPLCSRFALDDQRSGLINFYSDGTGHGKTTATAIASRVFGLPNTFTIKGRSQGATINAFFEMLGYAQSVPLIRDEITEMTTDELSDIVYALVNGKTKIRLQGQHNDIREGEKQWGTYVFSTSNKSIVDSLVTKKGDATAQYSRVTEIEYPLPTWLDGVDGKIRATRIVRKSEEFSGVAGARLLNWMVNNYELAKQMYQDTYDMLSSMTAAPRNKARFWLNHATGVVLGAIVGEQLGLHPFNPEALTSYALSVIETMHNRAEAAVVQVSDALGELLQSNVDQWLVLNDNDVPISTVHRDVNVRVEYKANRMWITASAIRQYAASRDRNAASIMAYLKDIGAEYGVKRMLAGTIYAVGSSPVRAFELDLSLPEVAAALGDYDDHAV